LWRIQRSVRFSFEGGVFKSSMLCFTLWTFCRGNCCIGMRLVSAIKKRDTGGEMKYMGKVRNMWTESEFRCCHDNHNPVLLLFVSVLINLNSCVEKTKFCQTLIHACLLNKNDGKLRMQCRRSRLPQYDDYISNSITCGVHVYMITTLRG